MWPLAILVQSQFTNRPHEWHCCRPMDALLCVCDWPSAPCGRDMAVFCNGMENGGCSETALTLYDTSDNSSDGERSSWIKMQRKPLRGVFNRNKTWSPVEFGTNGTLPGHDLEMWRQGTKLVWFLRGWSFLSFRRVGRHVSLLTSPGPAAEPGHVHDGTGTSLLSTRKWAALRPAVSQLHTGSVMGPRWYCTRIGR